MLKDKLIEVLLRKGADSRLLKNEVVMNELLNYIQVDYIDRMKFDKDSIYLDNIFEVNEDGHIIYNTQREFGNNSFVNYHDVVYSIEYGTDNVIINSCDFSARSKNSTGLYANSFFGEKRTIDSKGVELEREYTCNLHDYESIDLPSKNPRIWGTMLFSQPSAKAKITRGADVGTATAVVIPVVGSRGNIVFPVKLYGEHLDTLDLQREDERIILEGMQLYASNKKYKNEEEFRKINGIDDKINNPIWLETEYYQWVRDELQNVSNPEARTALTKNFLGFLESMLHNNKFTRDEKNEIALVIGSIFEPQAYPVFDISLNEGNKELRKKVEEYPPAPPIPPLDVPPMDEEVPPLPPLDKPPMDEEVPLPPPISPLPKDEELSSEMRPRLK